MGWPVLLPIITTVGNVLRAPAFAAFLAGLASQVLGWFTVLFTRRIAINLTIITLIVGVALGFIVAIKVLLAGLSFVVPNQLATGLSLFVPSNAVPCLSVILSAKVIRWVWVWQFYAITKISES